MDLQPIGVIRTCFAEKFGVPRQARMVAQARGTIHISAPFSHPDTVLGLEQFSHLWVVFLFHKAQTSFHPEDWRPTVQPPGKGAPERVGVFASRSPHRPNPIGMSAVKLESIHRNEASNELEIEVSGVDILDGSPVLDIKPYVPYADIIPEANNGWATEEIASYAVRFSPQAEAAVAHDPVAKNLITEVMRLDPRPRSQRDAVPLENPENIGKKFAFRFLRFDLHWVIAADATIHLVDVIHLAE